MSVFKAHARPVYSLAFSPEGGRLLSSGGDERELRRWDAATWNEEKPLDPGIGKLTAIAVSRDGQVAVGSNSGNIKIY